ncbi:hypothetical protein T265_01498, partial [Opisthorchis viverrini]
CLCHLVCVLFRLMSRITLKITSAGKLVICACLALIDVSNSRVIQKSPTSPSKFVTATDSFNSQVSGWNA